MGRPHPPEKSLLFMGLLFSDDKAIREAMERIRECFGNLLLETPDYRWDHSEYYRRELGSPILRRFIFFDRLFDASTLPFVKLETNRIELDLSESSRRRVNIDPGYITSSKVVLASAKDYSHRLYIGQGIYAEVALFYQGNRFNPMYYTYQDYRNENSLKMFEMARKELKRISGITAKEPDYRGESLHQNT